MGHTFRIGKRAKLTSDEWEAYGYCPRRRSVMFVVTESLLKLNVVNGKPGPYRQRYDEEKDYFARTKEDYSKQSCHWHGMLCMGKLLLQALWCKWNNRGISRRRGQGDRRKK